MSSFFAAIMVTSLSAQAVNANILVDTTNTDGYYISMLKAKVIFTLIFGADYNNRKLVPNRVEFLNNYFLL